MKSKEGGGGSRTREPLEMSDAQVGLGWVAHLTAMVSCLLGVPLRYSGVVMNQKRYHSMHLSLRFSGIQPRQLVAVARLRISSWTGLFDPNVFWLTFEICKSTTFRIPDKDREFPLFPKGNERVR